MNDLPSVLHADGPHDALGDQARVFDRFVGMWDCDYTHLAEDGSVRERHNGTVTFGWILGGHALQDVWSGGVDARGNPASGTSIRYFDADEDLWTIVWILPQAGVVTTMRGGAVGDRIVLEGANADGSARRWSFNDIEHDSFSWWGERSTDGGSTWQLEADYRMVRRAVDDPPSQPVP